jgi:multisubunit Na+/H+ antiporter MnhG subunit
LLALGDMLISLSKVFAFLLHVWHGPLIMHLIARASHEIRRRRLWNTQKVPTLRAS